MARRTQPRNRNFFYRLGWIISRSLIYFVVISVIWVVVYKFVPPPITFTMLGDVFAGRGLHKDWMGIGAIDPAMPRAVIAAEDAKFCAHDGFDREAIEKAIAHNARGRRIRGGSTISQQTAKNAFLWHRTGDAVWLGLLDLMVCTDKGPGGRAAARVMAQHDKEIFVDTS